jgi:hypothetical protein
MVRLLTGSSLELTGRRARHDRAGWLREHAARLTGLIGELEGRWTSDGQMADGALQAGER